MDYAHRRRIKLWGHARVVENDTALQAQLMREFYAARPEQVILFMIDAWDTTCAQHIPQKFDGGDVAAAIGRMHERIATLESRSARIRLRIGAELAAP